MLFVFCGILAVITVAGIITTLADIASQTIRVSAYANASPSPGRIPFNQGNNGLLYYLPHVNPPLSLWHNSRSCRLAALTSQIHENQNNHVW